MENVSVASIKHPIDRYKRDLRRTGAFWKINREALYPCRSIAFWSFNAPPKVVEFFAEFFLGRTTPGSPLLCQIPPCYRPTWKGEILELIVAVATTSNFQIVSSNFDNEFIS